MVFLIADHGGFAAKQKLAPWLHERHEVHDLGPKRKDPNDDYPALAVTLCRAVTRRPGSFGIAICRSGVGMAMAANKISGIRAAQAFTPKMAKQSRLDEDANILSLGADYLSVAEMKKVIQAWLATTYVPQVRHQRRLRQLKRLDHGR